MSKAEFGEPWVVQHDEPFETRVKSSNQTTDRRGNEPFVVALDDACFDWNGWKISCAHRAVDCVNALAGLDPAALPELIAAAEEPKDSELFAMLDALLLHAISRVKDPPYAMSLREQLRAWNERRCAALRKLRREA